MDTTIIYELAAQNPHMCSVERLVNLYWAVSSVLVHEVPGAIVDLGCNGGRTSAFFQILIDHFDPTRELHLYDSFEGLPAPGAQDGHFEKGELKATVDDVLSEFTRRSLRAPCVHKGWFEETFPASFPERVAFAYLDSDFYDSIMISLEYVYPRLSPKGIVIVDDYADPVRSPRAWDKLPGVKTACDDFLADKPEKMTVLVGNSDLPFAMMRKQ